MRAWRTAGLTALLLLATLTVSGCFGRSDKVSSDKCSRHAVRAGADTSATFWHVRMKVPQGWYVTQACFITGMATAPLGYLTTQPPIAQCRVRRASEQGHPSCGDPVDQLGDRDVLIRVVQDASRVPGTIPIAQIATAPLKSQNNSVYTGDRHVISENLRTPDGYITIDADFGGLERGVVRQFLRSVRYAS